MSAARSELYIRQHTIELLYTTTTSATEQHGVAQQTPTTPERAPTTQSHTLASPRSGRDAAYYPSPGSSHVEATSRLPRGQGCTAPRSREPSTHQRLTLAAPERAPTTQSHTLASPRSGRDAASPGSFPVETTSRLSRGQGCTVPRSREPSKHQRLTLAAPERPTTQSHTLASPRNGRDAAYYPSPGSSHVEATSRHRAARFCTAPRDREPLRHA